MLVKSEEQEVIANFSWYRSYVTTKKLKVQVKKKSNSNCCSLQTEIIAINEQCNDANVCISANYHHSAK